MLDIPTIMAAVMLSHLANTSTQQFRMIKTAMEKSPALFLFMNLMLFVTKALDRN